MCRVFLYSRVSTSAQTLAQQERTAYEWLNAHHMKVDEVVSDEGVSGGVSYADRSLGKTLLPRMVEGDMLIVSEVSRLGRSMYDLSKLIHTELKPRKIRLVCVSMGIDLNCAKMTAIDELILSNFSFAAQLEKQLISERTLSALEVKRKKGVKFGAASPVFQANRANKDKEVLLNQYNKMGNTKKARYQSSRKVTAFLRILQQIFPDATTNEDPHKWEWKLITTKGDNKDNILKMMKTMRDLDDSGHLWHKWDFDAPERLQQQRLAAHMHSIKRTFMA